MIFIPKKLLITAGQSFSVTGGTVTTDGGDNIHIFTSDGTLTVTGTVDVDVLIVAGGGGGGGDRGGGGGAGGLIYLTSQTISGGT